MARDPQSQESLSALRQKIVSAPHDETLRAVYLDCALELGDPHGEYVRLGCELERRLVAFEEALGERPLLERALYFRPRYAELAEIHDAIEDLYARHGHEFFEDFLRSPHFGRRTHFNMMPRRGFADTVTVNTQDELDFAVSVAPITDVEVFTPRGLRLPGTVRAVGGGNAEALRPLDAVDEADLELVEGKECLVLIQSPAFQHVTRLHISAVEPTPPRFVDALGRLQDLVEVTWFGENPPLDVLASLPRLRAISLDAMPQAARGFDSLRALSVGESCTAQQLTPWVERGCRFLRLDDVTATSSVNLVLGGLRVLYALTLDAPVVRALAEGSRDGELGVLRLGVTEETIGSLHGLHLHGPGWLGFADPLSDEALVTLGQCELRGVKTLRVPGAFSREALEKFSASPMLAGLDGLEIGCRDMRDLALVLARTTSLRSLLVSTRDSTAPNAHLQMIADMAHLHQLRFVNFNGAHPVGAFFESPVAEHLREIAFSELTAENIAVLTETPHLPYLNRLSCTRVAPPLELEQRFGHRVESLVWEGAYEHLPAFR